MKLNFNRKIRKNTSKKTLYISIPKEESDCKKINLKKYYNISIEEIK